MKEEVTDFFRYFGADVDIIIERFLEGKDITSFEFIEEEEELDNNNMF